MKKLPASFYHRNDVTLVAKELLGKLLVTNLGRHQTVGRIVETEAYNGVMDKASHAYGGRRTQRTGVMYAKGGVAYVYLCYGIHHLFNVVTSGEEVPHAILVRAIEPVAGLKTMLQRMKKSKPDFSVGRGPGNVSRALGIHTSNTGISLLGNRIFIADDGMQPEPEQVMQSPRIGVDYAAEDALLPYRFYLKGNPHVSGKK